MATRLRPFRTPPTVPRPHPVTQPDGHREYPAIDSHWPAPPPGRPRFAHHRLAEEFHGGRGVTYRTYAHDARVIEYGRTGNDVERAATSGTPHQDWVVLLWTAHPLLTPKRARLERVLIDNATFLNAIAALDKWELEGDGE